MLSSVADCAGAGAALLDSGAAGCGAAGRGAAVGQAVANMLKAVGYDVVSEYYINDAGR